MTSIAAIVPAYNRAGTLGRALDSVFGQTRVPDEVIVVDDGSTDDTAAVVQRFPRAHLLRLERNRGAASARNEGVRRSRAELIAFLDSDDAWHPDKLQRQLAHLAADPAVELLCTGITVHERGGAVADHVARGARRADGWSFADFQNYPFCPTTWLIRRSVFEQEGLFDETLRNCEDLDLLARIAHRRIALLPEPLAVKYNRNDSLDAALPRTAESYRLLFERHARLWERAPEAAAKSYRRLANMHLRAHGTAQARRALVKAIRCRPLDLRSWATLALSLLGPRAYFAVRDRWPRAS